LSAQQATPAVGATSTHRSEIDKKGRITRFNYDRLSRL